MDTKEIYYARKWTEGEDILCCSTMCEALNADCPRLYICEKVEVEFRKASERQEQIN
jgi:hypothetical protein